MLQNTLHDEHLASQRKSMQTKDKLKGQQQTKDAEEKNAKKHGNNLRSEIRKEMKAPGRRSRFYIFKYLCDDDRRGRQW